MSGSFRNTAIASARVEAGVAPVGVAGGSVEPEACPGVCEAWRASAPEAVVSSFSSSKRPSPPHFCPEMEGVTVGGGHVGQGEGSIRYLFGVEEFWYSGNSSSKMAGRSLLPAISLA